MRVKDDRSLGMYILLTVCTCGIYGYYFIYSMAMDANTLCSGDGKKTPGLAKFILFSFLTCGIYTIYWQYSLGNRLAENAPRYGLSFQENGTTVLMWRIFGILLCGVGAFVAMHILIKNMNALALSYNNRHSGDRENMPQSARNMSQDARNMSQDARSMPQGAGNAPREARNALQDARNTPQRQGVVECSRGLYQGAVFPVEGEIIIGRDAECSHIVIQSREVSRKHCGISYNSANGTYMVRDYSANGLYDKTGRAFPKNTPVACHAGTVLLIARSGNEFVLK